MIGDIYKRAKLLSRTCIKIALVLPPEKSMCHLARGYLIDRATDLAINSKGLMASQNPEYFLQKLSSAKESADGVNYWLELIKEEACLDVSIIDPILEESESISNLFALAITKVKPEKY